MIYNTIYYTIFVPALKAAVEESLTLVRGHKLTLRQAQRIVSAELSGACVTRVECFTY